jgi:rubrerythrin
MKNISKKELYILSYYRSCELAGSILFGKLALRTAIDKYRVPLTEHCLEEAEHAWLFTKLINDLGHIPIRVTQNYQTEYGKLFGLPENMLEIFCLTQVFEKRTLNHFTKHLNAPDVHPLVKKGLKKILDDECGHIGWIRKELDKYTKEKGQNKLDVVMKKIEKMDEQVYKKLSQSEPFRSYFKDLL